LDVFLPAGDGKRRRMRLVHGGLFDIVRPLMKLIFNPPSALPVQTAKE
jgi:hypothetical protein